MPNEGVERSIGAASLSAFDRCSLSQTHLERSAHGDLLPEPDGRSGAKAIRIERIEPGCAMRERMGGRAIVVNLASAWPRRRALVIDDRCRTDAGRSL